MERDHHEEAMHVHVHADESELGHLLYGSGSGSSGSSNSFGSVGSSKYMDSRAPPPPPSRRKPDVDVGSLANRRPMPYHNNLSHDGKLDEEEENSSSQVRHMPYIHFDARRIKK